MSASAFRPRPRLQTLTPPIRPSRTRAPRPTPGPPDRQRRPLRHRSLGRRLRFGRATSGTVRMHPDGRAGTSPGIDLKQLVDELRQRDLATPLLHALSGHHRPPPGKRWPTLSPRPMREFDYPGDYRGVYPIKVNQQRHIVEDLLNVRRRPQLRPGGRAASPSCWPCWPSWTTPRRWWSATASKTPAIHRSGHPRPEGRPQRVIPGGRESSAS